MRSAILLFIVSVALVVASVACGGDDRPAAPLPVGQRFLTAEDAPNSKADPVETRKTTTDFDAFIPALRESLIDPDSGEMRKVFQEAGFKAAGVDARFFGEMHTPRPSPHVFSSFIELESEDAATTVLDWLEADSKKPCPFSCSVQRSTFDVDDIDDGRGVRRTATAEDIERVGRTEEIPSDSYWVGFTVGRLIYTMDLHGPPGSVSEKQALRIASQYYDRLTGG